MEASDHVAEALRIKESAEGELEMVRGKLGRQMELLEDVREEAARERAAFRDEYVDEGRGGGEGRGVKREKPRSVVGVRTCYIWVCVPSPPLPLLPTMSTRGNRTPSSPGAWTTGAMRWNLSP